MDELQPSSSTPFDPYAVAPAFARSSSSRTDAPQQQLQQSEGQPSTSTAATTAAAAASTNIDPAHRQRLSVTALGDPSLMGELPTTDPLSILLQKHLPPHIRPPRDLSGTWHTSLATAPSNEIPDPFTLETASQPEAIDAETVRQAAASNSWRKIASLARSKVEEYYQLHSSPQLVDMQEQEELGAVLQWWSVRLYALTRLKLYSMLRTEMGALWQVLSTTVMEGEMMLVDSEVVPFTLRVLKATEPKFRGGVSVTLEQYTTLIRECKQKMRQFKSEGGERYNMWRCRAERVGLMLAYTLAEVKDYTEAMELLTPLIERCLKDDERREEGLHLVIVASRIWIQAGTLTSALHLLDRASTLLPPSSPLVHQLAHSRSLIHAISSHFDQTSFQPDTPASHLNAAITQFYTANLDSSLTQLEALMQNHPETAATDAVVFNLATLYELGPGSEAEVVGKKRQVLEKVARYAGEPGVSGSSFKL